MPEPFLRDLPVFAGLSCDEAARLGRRVIERRLPPRSVLFSTLEPAEYVYLLREGRVKLYRLSPDGRESIVAVLGPGDVFGEFLVGEDLCHSMCAETLESAFVCILSRNNFFGLLRDEPAIALAVIANIGRRLLSQADAIESLSTDDARARVIKLLLSLAGAPVSTANGWAEISVRLTHQDMGNMVALSRQTVTAVLNGLKSDGAVRAEGRSLWVDVSALSTALTR